MRSWKNLNRRFLIAGILLSAILGFAGASRASAETINNFDAKFNVQTDGAVSVAETITYDFGANQKHGIFRDIPLTAKDGPTLSIDVLGVAGEDGLPYPYTVSTANNVLSVKIGDPNVLVDGVKTYVISYEVYNAIRTFSDHDELYWNVTGNQWTVAILKASASVALPIPPTATTTMACFTGATGSTDKNCAFDFNSAGGIADYSTTQQLGAGEGLTIVAGIPLGYINNVYVPPTAGSNPFNTAPDSYFLTYIIIFLFSVSRPFIVAFSRKSKPVIPRELKGKPVVVEYNPPDNLPPIEIGTLLDRRVDIADISSVIMDLAVKGYIKIRYTVEPIRFFPDKKDFELIKLKDGADLVHPADKAMFGLLFNGRDSVKLSDLQQAKTAFQDLIKEIKESTEKHLSEEGYFDQAAKKASQKIGGWGIVVLIVLIVMSLSGFGFGYLIPAVIFGMLLASSLGVGSGKNKLTSPQGIATLAKILGFREFLQLTEKDKLALLNAPDLKPEIFEKFLPHAMVLGVEDKWASKFEGIYNTAPAWYEDSTRSTFSSVMLINNMVLFNSSFNQVFNITAPRSSSGFSGGSSGGGSGGGGGGSW